MVSEGDRDLGCEDEGESPGDSGRGSKTGVPYFDVSCPSWENHSVNTV